MTAVSNPRAIGVAPRAGRGLKQTYQYPGTIGPSSPPVRGRGLKLLRRRRFHAGDVAPRAGAWIETLPELEEKTQRLVAPRAGAWIETERYSYGGRRIWSPPVRGRGLKLSKPPQLAESRCRPPCGGVD